MFEIHLMLFWMFWSAMDSQVIRVSWGEPARSDVGYEGYYVYEVRRIDTGGRPFVALQKIRDGYAKIYITTYIAGGMIESVPSNRVYNPNFYWGWFVPPGTEGRWTVETSTDLRRWTEDYRFASLQMLSAGHIGFINRPRVGTRFYRLSLK